MSVIFEEYLLYASPKTRLEDQMLIESFVYDPLVGEQMLKTWEHEEIERKLAEKENKKLPPVALAMVGMPLSQVIYGMIFSNVSCNPFGKGFMKMKTSQVEIIVVKRHFSNHIQISTKQLTNRRFNCFGSANPVGSKGFGFG
jgi:hypothetical protein